MKFLMRDAAKSNKIWSAEYQNTKIYKNEGKQKEASELTVVKGCSKRTTLSNIYSLTQEK